MEIINAIESWCYPITDLFLLVYCLVKLRNRGGEFLAIGFAILFIMSLSWHIVSIFNLYSRYEKIYEVLNHINFFVYIIYTVFFVLGISRASRSANTQQEGTVREYAGNMSVGQILFSFDGRINRARFWGYLLPLNLIPIAGLIIDLSTTGEMGVFYGIAVLINFWPALALNVKRCHDRDKSGWFYLITLIPFLNFWYLIEIGFCKGTDGDNRFGPDPLGRPVLDLQILDQ